MRTRDMIYSRRTDIAVLQFQMITSNKRIHSRVVLRLSRGCCNCRAFLGTGCITVQPAEDTLPVPARVHHRESHKSLLRQHAVQRGGVQEQGGAHLRAACTTKCHIHERKGIRRFYSGQDYKRRKCSSQVRQSRFSVLFFFFLVTCTPIKLAELIIYFPSDPRSSPPWPRGQDRNT